MKRKNSRLKTFFTHQYLPTFLIVLFCLAVAVAIAWAVNFSTARRMSDALYVECQAYGNNTIGQIPAKCIKYYR